MSPDTFDNRAAMLAAMAKRPDLTFEGLDGPRRSHFAESRDELLSPSALHAFQVAIDWLRLVPRRAKVNPDFSSYGVKDAAERWSGTYISNGTFIAAALSLDIPIEQCEGPAGINALLAISSRRKWPAGSLSPNFVML
jgi:hypothetical protein